MVGLSSILSTVPALPMAWRAVLAVRRWLGNWRNRTMYAACLSNPLSRATPAIKEHRGQSGEIIRRFGFGEVDLIEGTGQIGYDGRHTYNGLFVHGDAQAWAVYRVILQQPITNDQAGAVTSDACCLCSGSLSSGKSGISVCRHSIQTVLPVMTVVTTTGAVNYGKSTRNPAVGKRHLPD
ncbi:putative bacteriophage tail fiber protein [Salmonella enterica subsp. enterica serovar Typhi]|nr:putative bacteriophage tail fiber protein [Salmonella enterica subsp. enterica serovar Typhi]